MSVLKLAYWQHHFVLADVPGHRRSKVIPARGTPNRAVVFVHGFTGDALETWRHFDHLLPESPRFQNCDIYFFGYDGFKSNTLAAASFLYRLLDDLGHRPASLLSPLIPSVGTGQRAGGYSRIVLAAHSLGALVSRWALLQAWERKCSWGDRVKVILFAPAHSGSELHRLTSQALGGFSWARALLSGAEVGCPLIRELQPGSPVLQSLAERTARAVQAGASFLVPACVVIAEREIVVNNVPFGEDPCPVALPDTTHESVCKPHHLSDPQVALLENLL
jgi:pimeloyl-ACP methyl ester carboxylesterase